MSKVLRIQYLVLLFLTGLPYAGQAIPGSTKSSGSSTPKTGQSPGTRHSIVHENWAGELEIDSLTESDIGSIAEEPLQSQPSTHALAIFSDIPDAKTLSEIEAKTGVRFLSVHSYDNDSRTHIVYVVSLNHVSLPMARKTLLNHYRHYFFNLIPFGPADKMTRKILHRGEFERGERRSDGLINASLCFFPDISTKTRDSLVNYYFPENAQCDGDYCHIHGRADDLNRVSELDMVSYVSERDTTDPSLNDVARVQTRVNNIQSVNTSTFPPSSTWMANTDNTGEGVVIGIYDEGIDSSVSDFREMVGGVSRIRRGVPTVPWLNPRSPHATHVAGIAAGNGWLSESSGGTRYQWRGVAFKSQLISDDDSKNSGHDGDVNNHSHVSSYDGTYDIAENQIDNLLSNHATHPHVLVYAAANNGGQNHNNGASPLGYYSILAPAKNPITVGATLKERPMRADFSSMGPTRDGRIKPDVMAPGGSDFTPAKIPTAMRIELDYVRIKNKTRTIAFEFNNSANGWINGYKCQNIQTSATALKFESNWEESWLTCPGQNFKSDANDTLIIQYRMIHPSIPSSVKSIQCGFSWNVASGSDLANFVLHTPDTNFHQAKFLLANLQGEIAGHGGMVNNYTPGITINQITLGFASDTALAIHSTATSGSSYGNYRDEEGTSMAAPHVSGIVALMLQEYQRKGFLKTGENIHDNAPWNSTLKALLVHTATDIVKTSPDWTEQDPENVGTHNQDLCQPVGGVCTGSDGFANSYHYAPAGPDYETGYGLVNAQAAVTAMDTTRFKQDFIVNGQTIAFYVTLPTLLTKTRVTLAWDDPGGAAGAPHDVSKLINDLDLVFIAPNGNTYYPWFLNPLPQDLTLPASGFDPIHRSDIQPAQKGVNTRDNVEVVDVQAPNGSYLPAGRWKLVVKGTRIPLGQQDFSVVSDFRMTKATHQIGWLWRGASCPEGNGFIRMDDEDDNNATTSYIKSGFSTPTFSPWSGTYQGVWKNVNETSLEFCRQTRDTLPQIRYDYAVLSFSSSCPTNSVPFGRFSDNEDDNNGNTNSGGIDPSTQAAAPTHGWTNMRFCFVPNNGIAQDPPWRALGHAAMANPFQDYQNCSEFHLHVQDDEDNGNVDSWDFTGLSQDYQNRILSLFNNQTTETHYFWNACP